MVRPVVRISKTPTAWRWYYEDWSLAGDQVLAQSGDFTTWKLAQAAAITAYPEAEVQVNAVRGWGIAYEDSLGMSGPLSPSGPPGREAAWQTTRLPRTNSRTR